MTETMIQEIISRSEITYQRMGLKTMVCHAILPNGFEVVVSAACANQKAFQDNVGKNICSDLLVSKIWELEAYRLHVEQAKND